MWGKELGPRAQRWEGYAGHLVWVCVKRATIQLAPDVAQCLTNECLRLIEMVVLLSVWQVDAEGWKRAQHKSALWGDTWAHVPR